MVSRENRVIVYVWLNETDGGEGVGHAALQTPESFISLFPGKFSNKSSKVYYKEQALRFFEHREAVNFVDYPKTIKIEEGRSPEFVCCLYSLNVKNIEDKMSELYPQIGNWSMLGNTKFNRPNDRITMSCSSLVYDLLIAGGIRNLTFIGLTVPMMPSPHNIFTIARSAKRYEMRKYPETIEFDKEENYEFNPHDEVSTLAIQQGIKRMIEKEEVNDQIKEEKVEEVENNSGWTCAIS